MVINCGEEIANYYDTLAVKGNPLLLAAQNSVGQKQSLMLTGDSINFQCNTLSVNTTISNEGKNLLYITNEDIALKLGVNFINSTGGQVGTISANASMFYFSAPRTLMMSSSLFSISANSLSILGSTSLTLKKGSYTYSLPDISGTIALTTDAKLYLLTLYWVSKNVQTIPDITANMYVSHLASGLSLGLNTFSGGQLSQAVTNILLGDYFSAKNPNLKIVASGFSMYNSTINICQYINYDSGIDTLVANLMQDYSSRIVSLGDLTCFSTLSIYITQISSI